MFRLKYLLGIIFLTLGFSSGVVINEIHYNPSLDLGYEDADYEFVELYNYTDHDIDITGWSLASNEIHYELGHHVLGSGEYALLCRNVDAYEGCIGHHGGALYNDGDQLWLRDAHQNVIDYVLYDDGQDDHDEFPPQADAEGPSIELINPSLAYGNDHSSDGSDWQASSQINGTPGYQNSDGGDLEPSNNIAFGAFCDSNVEILYNSNIDIAGFQFDLTGLTIENTYGGAAEEADFSVSNSESTVIGFSFDGNTIPAGEGLLLMVNTNDIAGEQCIDNIIVSDTDGNLVQSSSGECTYLLLEEECTNCDDELACNFGADASCEYPEDNFDCDGNCIVEEDCNGDCGGDAIFDDCGVCGGDGTSCDSNNFFDIPNSTGINHLVVIENVLGLEDGDEIGIFDTNGLISSDDCTDEYGELLVGAGIYDGSQMEIVGVGSLDFCDFPDGYQLSGWVEDNPIMIKIYDASQDYEYVLNDINYESGGQWNEQFSTIMELDANIYGCTDPEAGNYNQYATVDDNSCIYIVTQQLDMDGVILNNISLNVQPGNPDVESLFANHDVMFIANQDGQFYVPENDVNTIGDWDLSKGYHVLLNGFDNQMLQVEGYPVDLDNTTIRLEPFRLNNISFPLHQPISAADLVEGLPVIFCTDDQGHYYIPGSGFNTIDESGGMLPGKGYQVLIAGSEALEFTYSEPSSDNLGRNLAIVGSSDNYTITRTGLSHPMVINQITGSVSEGDELVAYANGVPVGVIPVNVEGSTLLVAWKSLYEYDLDTDGYRDGDEIELRLYSKEYNQEYRVMTYFNVDTYGESPITIGSIHVLNELAVPAEFGLSQNYPNPFNPTTTIDINVATDSYIMLNVYDINGRIISTLADDSYDAGYHSFIWNGLDQYGNKVSAGIYFYSLQTKEMTLTKKMILMK